jgi:LuxR family maltose regulon positive regulatory protein
MSSDAGAAGQPSRSRYGLRAVQAPIPGRADHDVPIETKFHAPALRKDLVERQEPVQRLIAAAPAKLVLVDAPAGFGKTTLVAQWQVSRMERRPFAWLTLDDGENDPSRLWRHIMHALQRASPGLIGEEKPQELQVHDPDITGSVLPVLLNELASLTAPVVLVLDGYQAITEPACHEQMTFFLVHLPPSAQVVLITRTDPPLPIARLRAAGEMFELRARELRFSPAEAALFVQRMSAAELSLSDIAVLVERTEGWPAGLYLAALSLRGHPSPSAFVGQFSGDNKFITDFLAEEVLSRQPAEIRQFLVRTSILSRFSAPLCDAVIGSANAAEIIDVLDRENLFVIPLDDARRWFRYHSLFAQMLRGYLTRAEPGLVAILHERARDWYRQSGSVDETTRLERLERQAAGRPKATSLAHPLTEREEAVLHLLQGTLSLREIGQELHLSANTIKTHAQAIYRKLGVSTRHDAVLHGHDAGLLLAARSDLRSARVAVHGGLLHCGESPTACDRRS